MKRLFSSKSSFLWACAIVLGTVLGTVTIALAQSITFDKDIDLQGTKKILNAANIGIGTASPGAKFEINGFTSSQGLWVNYGNATGQIEAITLRSNGGASGHIGLQMVDVSNADLWLGGSGGRAMTIYRDGNIGIGTTGPGAKLDVNGTTKFADATIWNDGTLRATLTWGGAGTMFYGASGQKLNLGANGATSDIVIDTSGNVGVATTTPLYTLSVNGTGAFNQPVLVGTPTVAGHAATKSYVDSSVTGSATQWTTTSTGVYYNSGNVGIGTTSPAQKLDVNGWINAYSGLMARQSTNSALIAGYFGAGGNINSAVAQYDDLEIASVNNLFFTTNNSGTPRLYIKTDGNVGIGTTSPGSLLHVVGGDVKVGLDGYGTSVMPTIAGATVGRQIALFSSPNSPALSLEYFSSGYGMDLWVNTAGSIDSYIDTRDAGSSLRFRTQTAATPVDAMIIKNNGNVGIGTTAPGEKLDVQGNIAINNGGDIRLYDAGDTNWRLMFSSGSTTPFTKSLATVYATTLTYAGGANQGFAVGVTGGSSSFEINGADHTAYFRGNVGIGTTSPDTALQIYKTDSATNTSLSMLKLTHMTSGTAATGLGAGITFGTQRVGGGIEITRAIIQGVSGSTEGTQGDLVFLTRTDTGVDTATTGMNEKMRILSTGNVGIGTTTPAYKLDVVGTAQFSQPVIVGTPTASNHAATKNYVDSAVLSPAATVVKGNCTGAVTIDWNAGRTQHCVLTGNVTFTFTNGQGGGNYRLVLKQDGVGSRAVTWPAGIRWGTLGTPSLSVVPAKTDYVGFMYNGVDSTYDGVAFNANY